MYVVFFVYDKVPLSGYKVDGKKAGNKAAMKCMYVDRYGMVWSFLFSFFFRLWKGNICHGWRMNEHFRKL